MVIEITTYKPAVGVTHEELLKASDDFNQNYCVRCKGLIKRYFLKTEGGYMDIFLWESITDVEHVQKTFMEDSDARAFAKYLDPKSLTMHNYEVISNYNKDRELQNEGFEKKGKKN